MQLLMMVHKMSYTLSDLGKALAILKEKGIEGVIIGNTVLNYYLDVREFEDDVDLFVTSLSPFFEAEMIGAKIRELGWEIGSTDLGTPLVIAVINGKEIIVELYENIFDFYVPLSMVNEALSIKLGNFRGRMISLEDYIVLKARAGRDKDINDLQVIASLIKGNRVKVNINKIRKRREDFDESEWRLIEGRLRSAGIKV